MLNDNKKHKDNQELAYEIIKVLDGVEKKDGLVACAIVSAFLIDTSAPLKYRQHNLDNFFALITGILDLPDNN